MPRRQQDPLRSLTTEEQTLRAPISRSRSEPASHVTRANGFRAVAAGQPSTAAARAAGRRSGDAVAQVGARCTHRGRAASGPGHGGGAPPTSPVAERHRILAQARRTPGRAGAGTATWSRMTLRRAVRSARAGRAQVRTGTRRAVLIAAGWRWHRRRRWGATGTAQRTRKSRIGTGTDPDAAATTS